MLVTERALGVAPAFPHSAVCVPFYWLATEGLVN